MSIDERILDVSKRFARELVQARLKVTEEKERLAKELSSERERLTEELRQRHQQVQAERGVLGHARERAEAVSAQLDDDVLALNVGGQLFSTQRTTLCQFEGSYLANLFSGRWEASIERDAEGRYFLDFDPASFRLVLNFLRSRRLEHASAPVPPPTVPPERSEHFQNLAEYLGLTEELRCAAERARAAAPAAPPQPSPALGASLLQSASAILGAFRSGAEGATAPAQGGVDPGLQEAGAGGGQRPAAPPVPFHAPAQGPGARAPAAPRPGGPAAPAGAQDITGASPAASSRSPSAPSGSGGSAASSAAGGTAKRLGWSRKAAHAGVLIDEAEPCLASVSDSRALGEASAVRATRGFQSGRHAWRVDVEVCSDWSYVGVVADAWSALSSPVGRALHSWGVASNGTVFACREEVGFLKDFTSGSRLVFTIDMEGRSVSVTIDGEEFLNVFTGLPAPIFPAVSNCRSPARYRLSFDPEVGAALNSGGSDSAPPTSP